MIGNVSLWKRALSAAEVRAEAENPFQVLRAPSHRIWFDMGVPSGGTTYDESLTESASVTDGFGSAATFADAFTETTTTGDSQTSAATFGATISEPATVGDSLAGQQTALAAFSEGITAGDTYPDTLDEAGTTATRLRKARSLPMPTRTRRRT